MFKRVLAAVDGSLISRQVADFARRLAQPGAAHVTVLHVVAPPSETLANVFGIRASDLSDALLREGQHLVDEICRDTGLIDADRLVAIGPPSQMIIAEAEDLNADLIVLGSYGTGGSSRVMLGSVGSRVAALAGKPVTIVR